MRYIHLFIFSLFFLPAALAQPGKRNCNSAVSTPTFQQLLREVQGRNSADGKLKEAKSVAENNCLSAAQVKQIATLFDNDYDRLEFCKVAYEGTVDKDNFYDVY